MPEFARALGSTTRLSLLSRPAALAAMTPAVSVIEMGPQSIRERWCAHAFGHPGCVVVDMLAGATTRSRPPIDVRCGLAHEAFEPRHVERAVYATRWDGSVVATFGTDGAIAVAAAGR